MTGISYLYKYGGDKIKVKSLLESVFDDFEVNLEIIPFDHKNHN